MIRQGLDHIGPCIHNVGFVVYSEWYGKPQGVSEQRRGQGQKQEDHLGTIAIIQVRDEGGLNEGNCRCGDMREGQSLEVFVGQNYHRFGCEKQRGLSWKTSEFRQQKEYR